MRAKYAGVCARTGRSYGAGAEIVKGSHGWEIVEAAAPPALVWMRMTDGRLREGVVPKVSLCGACAAADGAMEAVRAGKAPSDPYKMTRTGRDFICDRGHVLHVLSDEEVWDQVVLPNLHFDEEGVLSDKLGPARWETVKHFFHYERYRDLAEYHEDVDDFDLAEMYRGMRGGRWVLNSKADMEKVENLIGILPENRRAVRSVREAEEREREQCKRREERERAQAMEAARQRLFVSAKAAGLPPGFDGIVRGLHVKWRGGFTIYGGGEEFVVDEDGAHVWHLVNNGADGDNWSFNNVRTGGAGAIGRRYPVTDERMAFLHQLDPTLASRLGRNT